MCFALFQSMLFSETVVAMFDNGVLVYAPYVPQMVKFY